MYPLAAAYPESITIPISRAVEMIGALKMHELGFTGKGIKVAVLDTGVSQDHPMIRPNIIHAESMVEGESPEDAHGHGSWTASAIAGVPVNTPQGQLFGVAPEAKLIILKVLSDKGSGSMAGVVAGMERAVELGADIVSMSLGSLFGTNLSPDSRTLNELATRNGVLFVVASGNSFAPFSIGSPGCAALSIGVGAVAMQIPSNGAPSTYSSKGPTLDGLAKPNISTYGGNVLSPGLAELLYAAGAHGGYSSMAGTCVPGDTYVLVYPGIPKCIKDIYAGEIIYSFDETTNQLKQSKVLEKHTNGIQATYILDLLDRTIRATSNHPFLVCTENKMEWKPLSEIKVGDYVLCLKKLNDDGNPLRLKELSSYDEYVKLTEHGASKLRSVRNYSIGFESLSKGTITQLTQRLYGTRKSVLEQLFTKNKLQLEESDYEPSSKSEQRNGHIPETTDVDFARLYGYLLGDGWITLNHSRSWQICCAEKSDEAKNEKYMGLFKRVFGLDMTIHRNKNQDYGWYYTYSKRVGELLYNLGLKESSSNKQLGEWIFKLPLNQKRALIDGLIDADGFTRTRSKNSNRTQLELSNEKLISQVKQLCHQVGYQCTKIHSRERLLKAPNSKEATIHTSHSVDIHKYEKTNTTTDYNNFIKVKVKAIKLHDFEEVFDLTVEGTHNFIAENVVIHNSMATPIVSGALALLLSSGVPRDRAVMEELFARTGGQPLNTITGWGLLDVMKLHEAAAAGVAPLLSVLGNVPYALMQPLYQLIPRPKPETIRLQVI